MENIQKAKVFLNASMILLEEENLEANILFPEQIGDLALDAVVDTIEYADFLSLEFEQLRDKLLKYAKRYRKKFSWKEIYDTLIIDDFSLDFIEKIKRYFRNCFSEM